MTDDAYPARAGSVAQDLVDVVGVSVSSDIADAPSSRPCVVIVTNAWGSNWGERAAATRFVAGAVALRARVVIVSIEDRSRSRYRQDRLRHDGIFPVYSAAAPSGRGTAGGVERAEDVAADALQSDLVRASLARQPGSMLPEAAARGLMARAGQPSSEAVAMTMAQQPDVVVLAGPAALWMADALPIGSKRPRVVLLPLCGDDPVLSSAAFRPLADQADAIGVFSALELERVTSPLPDESASRVHRLLLALPVNRLAATAGIVGVAAFGRYALMISGFADDPASGRCPPHDYLRHVFGDIAVAEVRRHRWLVTGPGRSFEMTWAPTRMNLWRLMAQAAVTVDLRSPGPIGREAIESLRFGTPVVVPDSSVAAEHAAASNGGLWYRNQGEMVDFVRAILEDDAVRSQLGANGERWSEQTHGDTESFVTEATRVVLGPPGHVVPEASEVRTA
jgi:glycosyltransferase involved in cell wall biosynthesis